MAMVQSIESLGQELDVAMTERILSCKRTASDLPLLRCLIASLGVSRTGFMLLFLLRLEVAVVAC